MTHVRQLTDPERPGRSRSRSASAPIPIHGLHIARTAQPKRPSATAHVPAITSRSPADSASTAGPREAPTARLETARPSASARCRKPSLPRFPSEHRRFGLISYGSPQATSPHEDLRCLRPPLHLAEEVGGLLGAGAVLFPAMPPKRRGLLRAVGIQRLARPGRHSPKARTRRTCVFQSPDAPVVSCSRCAFLSGNSTTTSWRDASS